MEQALKTAQKRALGCSLMPEHKEELAMTKSKFVKVRMRTVPLREQEFILPDANVDVAKRSTSVYQTFDNEGNKSKISKFI